jgi:hypothetical protein
MEKLKMILGNRGLIKILGICIEEMRKTMANQGQNLSHPSEDSNHQHVLSTEL